MYNNPHSHSDERVLVLVQQDDAAAEPLMR